MSKGFGDVLQGPDHLVGQPLNVDGFHDSDSRFINLCISTTPSIIHWLGKSKIYVKYPADESSIRPIIACIEVTKSVKESLHGVLNCRTAKHPRTH